MLKNDTTEILCGTTVLLVNKEEKIIANFFPFEKLQQSRKKESDSFIPPWNKETKCSVNQLVFLQVPAYPPPPN